MRCQARGGAEAVFFVAVLAKGICPGCGAGRLTQPLRPRKIGAPGRKQRPAGRPLRRADLNGAAARAIFTA